MKLLVVLVNYHGYALTADCLDSVAAIIDEVPGTRVGLCDNGSGRGEAGRLAAFIQQRGYERWCTLTAIDPNLGFTGGNNAVIRPALQSADPPDYVLLLNNDTLVYPGAFKTLVDFMDRTPHVGCAGSRLEDRPTRDGDGNDVAGAPQVSAFRFFDLVNEFQGATHLGPVYRLLRRFAVGMDIPTQNTEADWVAGASLIIRREVMEKIGPLDDGYYTYFDDIDFCRSAKHAGWPTWYVPASRVVHLVGQTTGITTAQTDEAAKRKKTAKPRADYWFQARHRYWLKHHGKPATALADLALIAGTAVYRVTRLLSRRDHGVPARFLRDCIAKSVFVRGFRTPHVTNPATGGPNPATPNVVNAEPAPSGHAVERASSPPT